MMGLGTWGRLIKMKHKECKMEMKRYKVLASLVLSSIFLISLISAIGVGSSYSRDYPLKMYPGETKEVPLSLQNSDVESGITLNAVLNDPSGIASLDKDVYTVGYLEQGVAAKINIRIPRNANIGDRHTISVAFTQTNFEESGMIPLGTKITKSFDVLIVEKPIEPVAEAPAPQGPMWAWIIAIIIIIIIVALVIYLIIKKRRH